MPLLPRQRHDESVQAGAEAEASLHDRALAQELARGLPSLVMSYPMISCEWRTPCPLRGDQLMLPLQRHCPLSLPS